MHNILKRSLQLKILPYNIRKEIFMTTATALSAEEKTTLEELSAREKTGKSTRSVQTSVIDALEKRGLVRRTIKNTTEGKQIPVFRTTPDGDALILPPSNI